MRIEISVQGPLLDELSEQFFWEQERGRPSLDLPPGTALHMVARVKGLAITIWSDEHPPPIFTLASKGMTQAFRLMIAQGYPEHTA